MEVRPVKSGEKKHEVMTQWNVTIAKNSGKYGAGRMSSRCLPGTSSLQHAGNASARTGTPGRDSFYAESTPPTSRLLGTLREFQPAHGVERHLIRNHRSDRFAPDRGWEVSKKWIFGGNI